MLQNLAVLLRHQGHRKGTEHLAASHVQGSSNKTSLWCPESCVMSMAEFGWLCQDQAGHRCGPYQQCLIHVRIWHGLDGRCLACSIQRLLQQLLQQGGVAEGQPRQPLAEGGDALLQATCSRGQVGSDAW